jgi:hypothetical protein
VVTEVMVFCADVLGAMSDDECFSKSQYSTIILKELNAL